MSYAALVRSALLASSALLALAAVASVARAQDAGPPADAGVAGAPDAATADLDAGAPADVDAGAPVDVDAAPDAGATAAPRPRVIVIDAAPYGIDPIVGTFVSRTMRETATQLGYDVLTAEESVAAAQQLPMPYPPTPADLWRVTWLAHAERGAFARVYAAQGQYVVEMTVASTDGGGPFYARGTAPAQTLLGVVGDLVRQTLPPPGVRTAPTAPQNVTPPYAGPPTQLQPATPAHHRRHGTGGGRRWALVGVLDAAFGLSQDFFFNFLAGARLDFRITPDIRVGVGALGAMLRGKGGLVGNVLFLAQIEDRLRIASDSDVLVPLRFALGYLPFNGPFIRLAAGVAIPFERQYEFVIDLLAVDFWVLPEHTVVSLDVATELGVRF